MPEVSEIAINNVKQVPQRSCIANVLLVDDDPQLTRFMLEILARKGIGANLADSKKTGSAIRALAE